MASVQKSVTRKRFVDIELTWAEARDAFFSMSLDRVTMIVDFYDSDDKKRVTEYWVVKGDLYKDTIQSAPTLGGVDFETVMDKVLDNIIEAVEGLGRKDELISDGQLKLYKSARVKYEK